MLVKISVISFAVLIILFEEVISFETFTKPIADHLCDRYLAYRGEKKCKKCTMLIVVDRRNREEIPFCSECDSGYKIKITNNLPSTASKYFFFFFFSILDILY